MFFDVFKRAPLAPGCVWAQYPPRMRRHLRWVFLREDLVYVLVRSIEWVQDLGESRRQRRAAAEAKKRAAEAQAREDEVQMAAARARARAADEARDLKLAPWRVYGRGEPDYLVAIWSNKRRRSFERYRRKGAAGD